MFILYECVHQYDVLVCLYEFSAVKYFIKRDFEYNFWKLSYLQKYTKKKKYMKIYKSSSDTQTNMYAIMKTCKFYIHLTYVFLIY